MARAGLTPDRVIEEAARVADESGWDGLSLASVAGRLGVKLPSLYKHVASLDALRGEVAARATQELADEITAAAVGRSGRDALHAVADAYRAYARRHPGRYAASVRSPDPESPTHVAAGEAALSVILATLRGYGLDGSDAVDATRALRAALHGFVALETGGGFGLPQDVDRSFRRLVDGFDATLTAWASSPSAD